MSARIAVLTIGAEIVAHLDRMSAENFGDGGLHCIYVVRSDIASTVADRSERRVSIVTVIVVNAETRQVPRISEERRRLRRETKALGIKLTFVLAHVRFQKAREAKTKIEYGCAGESVGVVVAETRISPREEVTCWRYTVDQTAPGIA